LLKWPDIIKFTSNGNPEPDKRIEKSDAEWKSILTPEQYRITRQRGTERPFSSEMCSRFESGIYACVCCDTLLFDASDKFESGTGWPSFTQPIEENAIAYLKDSSQGMIRVETTCNTCDAHLGHVFPDGPQPGGLRYCMNAIALKKIQSNPEKATFGGGCFWCTEAVFQKVRGVKQVISGYSGGRTNSPTYREVCNGNTGHAEVVQITFDPGEISYADLLRLHLSTHDPTTLNYQGADHGTQYRSIILPHTDEQAKTAREIISEMAPAFADEIVTEIKPFEVFYAAEDYHQNYYQHNPDQGYCAAVISPKLEKFRRRFIDYLSDKETELQSP